MYQANSVNLEFRRVIKEIGGAREVNSREEASWIFRTEWDHLLDYDFNAFFLLVRWFSSETIEFLAFLWVTWKAIPALLE